MRLTKTLSILIVGTSYAFAQADFTPPTALFREVIANRTAAAKELLARGANPNEGRFFGFSAVFFPVLNHNMDLFQAMVAKGADIHARDRLGSTTLMWAAFDEAGRTEMLEELLRLGLDPNTRNTKGESALTWALRRGETPIVRRLRRAGATHVADVKNAAESAIRLLERSGPQFVRVSGCVSCHHQALPQMASAVARAYGIPPDVQTASQQVDAVMAVFRPLREAMEKRTEKIPSPEISVSYSLLGLAAQGYPADATTAAMAHLLTGLQRPDGGFRTIPARPPLESSDFTATALSLRAMQLYGKPPADTIERAAEWLRTAQPRSTEDRAMQLLGLTWAKASSASIAPVAVALLAEQRPDGGWSQLPALETDAYATGQALVALHRAGVVGASDLAYQRGVDYLLRTQIADGSWLVRTRSFPVQPLKESGFPHGKDQWISAAGTSWAAMALSLSLPVPASTDPVLGW